jgi:ABC-type oligopeptide transport system ATPase subunit
MPSTDRLNSPSLACLAEVTRWFNAAPFSFRPAVRAVSNVTLSVRQGEIIGLVGASGSGKSTVGRLLAGLLTPSAGHVRFRGTDLSVMSRRQVLQLRQRVQYVFQSASAALSPRRRLHASLEEPLVVQGGFDARARQGRVLEAMTRVGLSGDLLDRYPHQLSGGQRQRAVFARSLVLQPELLIADEPIASLDVSIQAQILHLMVELRQRSAMSIVLISHDIAAVNSVVDRVAVMDQGAIVELGERRQVLFDPVHPYTRSLLAASTALVYRGVHPEI